MFHEWIVPWGVCCILSNSFFFLFSFSNAFSNSDKTGDVLRLLLTVPPKLTRVLQKSRQGQHAIYRGTTQSLLCVCQSVLAVSVSSFSVCCLCRARKTEKNITSNALVGRIRCSTFDGLIFFFFLMRRDLLSASFSTARL